MRMPYVCRGEVSALYDVRTTCEVLVEGPAGTGKSRGGLQWLDWMCWEWPYLRVLLCRLTRTDMTETVLSILEEEVYWPGHPVLTSSNRKRDQRSEYRYPNGSCLFPRGVEDWRKQMSAQYDIIYFVEATDGTEEGWDYLMSRGLGRQRDPSAVATCKIPYKVAVAEVNPDREGHWLNKRAEVRAERPLQRLEREMLAA